MKTRFGLVGFTNLLLVIVIIFVIWITKNPLALLACVLLRDSPVMPHEAYDPENDEDDPKSIGFIDTNDQ